MTVGAFQSILKGNGIYIDSSKNQSFGIQALFGSVFSDELWCRVRISYKNSCSSLSTTA